MPDITGVELLPIGQRKITQRSVERTVCFLWKLLLFSEIKTRKKTEPYGNLRNCVVLFGLFNLLGPTQHLIFLGYLILTQKPAILIRNLPWDVKTIFGSVRGSIEKIGTKPSSLKLGRSSACEAGC